MLALILSLNIFSNMHYNSDLEAKWVRSRSNPNHIIFLVNYAYV